MQWTSALRWFDLNNIDIVFFRDFLNFLKKVDREEKKEDINKDLKKKNRTGGLEPGSFFAVVHRRTKTDISVLS